MAGHWTLRDFVEQEVEAAARAAAQRNDPTPIRDLLARIQKLGNVWRFYNCNHEATGAYETLLYKVLENPGAYGAQMKDVVQQIDRTELYYNLGFLRAKEQDYDQALNWFYAADREDASKNGHTPGDLFRRLIEDNDSPFWNLAANIKANCSTFMPGVFGPYEFSGVFGRDMQEEEFKGLMRDLPMPLFLQFFHAMLTYWKNFSSLKGMVRFVRLSRVIAELCHVLDCYLGDQSVCVGRGTLFDKLTAVVGSDVGVRTEFERANTVIGRGLAIGDVNAQFTELRRLIEAEPAGKKKWSYCLLAAHRMRNYTAHDMDDTFVLNTDPLMAKKIFLAVLMAFFVSRKLLGVWIA